LKLSHIGRALSISLCVLLCLFAGFLFLNPQTNVWDLPVLNRFVAKSVGAAAQPTVPAAAAAPPAHLVSGPCTVAPLPPITDPVAEAFNTGEFLDTSHLTRGMSRALARFQKVVSQVGGSLELKSAYRPPAYQQHLQQVWDKWMELRNNNVAACQDLRAQVQQEFIRHHLLETQRPVTSSDHTRGMAFDATVAIPPNARIRRRKVTLDRLARRVGLRRPDIARDPVHFKFVGLKSTRG
jgi:hypothetical protein